jgi:hypothetical protein
MGRQRKRLPIFQLEYVQMRKRRSSTQLEQEKKSRLQLEERLTDFGWHLSSPNPDLGEDFIVEVYHEGQNTGVTFYIQEKSVTNIEERKNKDNRLVYKLKVKDLIHWEGFSLPVVIVVWDINLRIGKWGLAKDLIKHLDKRNPQWRSKGVVQVYIPWENETTDGGLKRLKVEIGRQVYPLISFGKDLSMQMKLAFPNTPEGIKLQKSFDLHVKEGEPVTLKGNVIQELKFSDWWETWFGGFDLKQAELYFGEISPQHTVQISIKIIPINGKSISLSNLEFRLIRAGTELIRFSNEHTACPLLINLKFRKEGNLIHGNPTFTFRHVGGDPHEIVNFTDFMKALEKGGKLRLEFQDVEQSYTAEFPPISVIGLNLDFYDLVQKLCLVQDKTGHFFKIPEEGLSQKNANSILELFEIVENGEVHYQNASMYLELKDKALQMFLDVHKQGKFIHLKSEADDSFVELFDEEISTGPMIREITGYVEMDVSEFEKRINVLKLGGFLKVNLVDVNGTETFSNWKIPSDSSEV